MRYFLEVQYQLPPNAVSCGQNPTIAYQAATAKVLIGNSIRGISLDNILQRDHEGIFTCAAFKWNSRAFS